MANANIKRAVQISICLLLTAGPLGGVHAADDGINTHAPYLTFDPNTGKFVEVDPSKTGAAGQAPAGGQNAAAAPPSGAGQAATQAPAAGQGAAAAPADAGQAAPGFDTSSLITLVGAVVLLGVLGALVWNRRRKREAATSA
jgi:LPXTG-motif cell wall-anchored protein